MRPDPPGEKVLGSGIVIPDGVDDRQAAVFGQVLASSNRRDTAGRVFAASVLEGDRVLWPRYAGQTIDHHGEQLVVLKPEEVLAVIE